MPWSEQQTLASLAAAPSVHGDGDFIADRMATLSVSSLLASHHGAALAYSLRGKSVLLALPGQLVTIAALLALDGVARRIVIWPGDTLPGDISAVMQAASVDAVVTSWPMPDGAAHRTAPPHAPVATDWVLFTSGTTGRPKMIVHTLASLAGHLAGSLPQQKRPIWCSFYDIRRYGGMQIMLRALAGGGSLVLSDPTETPAEFLRRAAAAGATHFLGTPSHWRRALMARAQSIISPAYVRLSGEVADQVVLDRLRLAFPQAALVHAFASTEAGLAFEVTDGLAGFPDSLMGQGRLADVRLVDGALHVRSPRNAAGILDGRLHRLANGAGFVETGDHVEHRDGRYHIAGRSDGVVNVGGQKVHPEEVEAVLNQHPDVQMSLVSARPNPITGAIVVARVVAAQRPSSNSALRLEDDIRAFCRGRLPPHMIPASVRLVPSLDVAPSGKMVRVIA
jgi:acyl-coenzyme A synthetase/AMP-(fatty) acid ligase